MEIARPVHNLCMCHLKLDILLSEACAKFICNLRYVMFNKVVGRTGSVSFMIKEMLMPWAFEFSVSK